MATRAASAFATGTATDAAQQQLTTGHVAWRRALIAGGIWARPTWTLHFAARGARSILRPRVAEPPSAPPPADPAPGYRATTSTSELNAHGVQASTAARGVRPLGGFLTEEGTNAVGGRLITSVGAINQNDIAPFVERAMIRGDSVHILSGAHGAADGTWDADAAMYAVDVVKFGSWPRVTIHNVAEMAREEISAVLRGPGTIIGGFCESAICLAPFK